MKRILLLVLCLFLLGATLLLPRLYTQRKNAQDYAYSATASVPQVTTETEPEQEQDTTPEKVKPSAPELSVTDETGRTFTLEAFLGKPVILHFFSSDYISAEEQLAVFEKAYNLHGDSVHFVMIDVQDGVSETEKSFAEFLEDKEYSFPFYFDTTGQSAENYGVTEFPATFFLDKTGRSVAYSRKFLATESFSEGLERVQK